MSDFATNCYGYEWMTQQCEGAVKTKSNEELPLWQQQYEKLRQMEPMYIYTD